MPRSFSTPKFSGRGPSKDAEEAALITFAGGTRVHEGEAVPKGESLTFYLTGSAPGRPVWNQGLTLEIDGEDGPTLNPDLLRAGFSLPVPDFDVSLRGRLGDGAGAIHGVSLVPVQPGQPTAPIAKGALADLTMTKGIGQLTLNAAANFTGDALVYGLTTAPAGVTLDPQTGLLTIDTEASEDLSSTLVSVRATNEAGSVDDAFSLTIDEAEDVVPGGTVQIDVPSDTIDKEWASGANINIGSVPDGSTPDYLLTMETMGFSEGDLAAITYTLSDGVETTTGEVNVVIDSTSAIALPH